MTIVRPPSATWTRRQTSRLELIMLRIMFFIVQVEGVQPLLNAHWLSVLEDPETQLQWAESYVALRAGTNSGYQPGGLSGLAHRLGQLEFTFDFCVVEVALASDYG